MKMKKQHSKNYKWILFNKIKEKQNKLLKDNLKVKEIKMEFLIDYNYQNKLIKMKKKSNQKKDYKNK